MNGAIIFLLDSIQRRMRRTGSSRTPPDVRPERPDRILDV